MELFEVMLYKKIRKLFKNPKKFWDDSKFNPKNNKIIKKNYILNNQTTKQKKDLIINNNLLNNKEALMKPIENFDIFYIINNLKVPGIFIKPLDVTKKYAIAIDKNYKKQFILAFTNFLYEESISLKYKLNSKIKTPNTINEFWNDISQLNTIDIRLSTTRTLEFSKFWFRLEFWDNLDGYYLAPTSNHISRRLYKDVANKNNIFKNNQIVDYKTILKKEHPEENTLEIDLVFTWVNSNDEDWQKLYEKYKPNIEETDATSTSRFLSRDELKYALRSWDKYGSFIRNIYIVSNCKPPQWLNLDRESNIYWIDHEEIMPKEVLPTFSSHAIETSLHKIKGLSNYFIYCNDDIVLTRNTTKNDFYYPNGIVKLKLEPYGNVNGEINENDPDYLNAARNSNKLLEKTFNKTPTQLHTHSPQAMRADILSRMENEYKDYFQRTLKNRFRHITDISVTSYLYQHYAFLSGNAIQSNIKTELIHQNKQFKKIFNKILKTEENKRPLSVCLNDGEDSYLNESWNIEVIKFLETLFPEPSKYEI
jgi:hypothetical protein